ncbi:MAG: 4-aminobutyrate--2-oxoglutarate transaminase [Chloroflexaceae bacterium]|jgi:4-aminobutyrate aminotransferase/(S)-3-amino-2-methylpropionate transaminase|nr:4-aminobutyrate--2-oxoglutarate transaminase [Chloroflexaceae bacterium]
MTDTATRSINLLTAVPGPKSRELVARREASVVAGLGKATAIAVDHASGATVTDVDGNTYLDFVTGIGVLAVGHCPPEVVAAVQAQAAKLIHMSALVATYESYVELSEQLNAAVPISGPCKTLLSNSGAEAVENAIKIARAATGRQAIVAFDGGYHGRTLLTLSLTSRTFFKKKFGPFAPEIYRASFPYAYRMGLSEAEAVEESWAAFERMLIAGVDAEAIAGVIIEPVQGEGGFIPVPPEFLRRLREFCTRNGSVLIADEVQCGFGRTGTLFAIEQSGVEPDVIISAKSLAAGMPLAATTGKASLMDAAHYGGVGGTYGGNPLACVAAIATMRLIERDNLLGRANEIGQHIRQRASTWLKQQGRTALVGDVRGLGAMLALELVRNRETREPISAQETLSLVDQCVQRGLLVMRAGLYANCIRLLVPLIISDEQLDEGLDVLEEVLIG